MLRNAHQCAHARVSVKFKNSKLYLFGSICHLQSFRPATKSFENCKKTDDFLATMNFLILPHEHPTFSTKSVNMMAQMVREPERAATAVSLRENV